MLLGSLKPDKQPAESFMVGIDFAPELATGEYITDATPTARKLSDGSDATATFLSGNTVIAGTTVQKRIIGGVVGETYRVQIKVLTIGGNIYEHEFDVPVSET